MALRAPRQRVLPRSDRIRGKKPRSPKSISRKEVCDDVMDVAGTSSRTAVPGARSAPTVSAVSALEAARQWLGAYRRAWEERDPDAAARLFTEDGSYAWGPFEEPMRGRRVIWERWADVTRHQRDVHFGSEMLGVVEAGAVARWRCSFAMNDVRVELEGIFLIALTADGECREFREWWNERTTPINPSS